MRFGVEAALTRKLGRNVRRGGGGGDGGDVHVRHTSGISTDDKDVRAWSAKLVTPGTSPR